jgi:hypothetical protein
VEGVEVTKSPKGANRYSLVAIPLTLSLSLVDPPGIHFDFHGHDHGHGHVCRSP